MPEKQTLDLVLITGPPRGGTTFTASLVGKLLNLQAAIEPGENPHVGSRLAMMGIREPQLSDLDHGLIVRTQQAIEARRVHIEKDTVFGPYLSLIEKRFRSHFVLPVRRPEMVVESLTYWMDQGFGNAYKEDVPHTFLSPHATELALERTIMDDPNDLGFPRPEEKSIAARRWNTLSRVGKFAFLWAEIMSSVLDSVRHLDRTGYTFVNLDLPYEEIHRLLAEKLGAQATVSPEHVDANSRTRQSEAFSDQRPRFEWSSQEWADFHWFTEPVLAILQEEHGIKFTEPKKPTNFGTYWERDHADFEWFKWMHNSRQESHDVFLEWLTSVQHELTDVLEVGCGAGVYYPRELLSQGLMDAYIGLDVARSTIASAQKFNADVANASFVIGDVRDVSIPSTSLVFSQGTADNDFDLEGFIQRCCKLSSRYVYLVFYRPFVSDSDHRRQWVEGDQTVYCDVSASRLEGFLDAIEGWRRFSYEVFVSNSGVYETHLVLRKAPCEVFEALDQCAEETR